MDNILETLLYKSSDMFLPPNPNTYRNELFSLQFVCITLVVYKSVNTPTETEGE